MRALILTLAMLLGAGSAAQAQTAQIEYYHLDAVGSVRAVTNQAGQVVRTHEYFPFGDGPDPLPASGQDALRFTGKERDAETGLHYFGARYYGARGGRFTTVDPAIAWQSAFENPQLWNRYSYALNNPMRFVDPDGRCVWDLCVGEGAAAYMVGAAAVATTAWLISPPGREAVSHVIDDTRMIVTTATKTVGSWFRTEKRPGRLGKPDHQQTVAEEAARIGGRPEVKIPTPGGLKDYRRADAVGTNPRTGKPEIVQVYRPTPAGNVPKRETDAAGDIENARGIKPTMVPVRPVSKPKTP